MRKFQLFTASAIALMAAAPAFAQDTTQSDPDAAATEVATTDEGEIIISAQGRTQIAQDVPLAVAVVDAQLIENAGISDVRGLKQLTPSLQTTTGQSSATGVVLSIRGIGTAGDQPGFEPAVGVFIDGVFRARAGLALAELPELDRVEVLRGPQGTLFGRNTSAGALNIITARPKFEFGGYGEVAYGNYNEIEAKGGVNLPASEQLAFRVDGGYHKRDGYATDVNTGRRFNNLDRWFARGQALYEGSDLSVRVIADYSKTDEQCCIAIHRNGGLFGTVVNTFAGAAGVIGTIQPNDPANRRFAITPSRDFGERVKDWGVSAELNYSLGDYSITSITAYREFSARRNQDIDFSGIDRAYRDGYRTSMRDFSQELRFQGTAFDGKLDFLVGGFYLNETLKLTDTVRLGAQASQFVDGIISGLTTGLSPLAPNGFTMFGTIPGRPFVGNLLFASLPPAQQAAIAANPALLSQFTTFVPPTAAGNGQQADNYTVDTQAFALFTHNIINVTDALSLTLGLRYNRETKDLKTDLNVVNPACASFAPTGARGTFYSVFRQSPFAAIAPILCSPAVNPEFNGSHSDSRTESELTGTARIAYKVNEDILLFGGYSHGYKSGGYNLDRLNFDTAYLYPRAGGMFGNGAQGSDLAFDKETVDSYEVGFKTNFSRAFQFNVTGFYQDFSNFQNLRFNGSAFIVTQFDEIISKGVELESIIRPHRDLTVNIGYTRLSAVVNDPVLGGVDHDKQITNQPKNVITASATWTPRLSRDVGALFHVDMRMNSDANTINDPVGVPLTTNDGYIILNARVGLDFMDGKFGLEAYVENLTNTYYNITSFPVPEQQGAYAVYPGLPRFYGLKAKMRF